jgi:hypothetical protein
MDGGRFSRVIRRLPFAVLRHNESRFFRLAPHEENYRHQENGA